MLTNAPHAHRSNLWALRILAGIVCLAIAVAMDAAAARGIILLGMGLPLTWFRPVQVTVFLLGIAFIGYAVGTTMRGTH